MSEVPLYVRDEAHLLDLSPSIQALTNLACQGSLPLHY